MDEELDDYSALDELGSVGSKGLGTTIKKDDESWVIKM